MKQHKGIRPQDIVILLKIVTLGNRRWYIKDVAYDLGISQSETSESLHRSAFSGLMSADKKKVMKRALLEFLEYGLKYVFPQRPQAIVRGKATAHSAPPLNKIIQSEEVYVWPSPNGTQRGQYIEPLHKEVVMATEKDLLLYELLALTDALRVGKVREQKIAIELLKQRILNSD